MNLPVVRRISRPRSSSPPLDAAVASGDQHAVTAVCATPVRDDPRYRSPAALLRAGPIVDHYARRELYRSPQHGYSDGGDDQGPGPGTPLHDHSGLWCVEGVWDGELEITQYELLEPTATVFASRRRRHAGWARQRRQPVNPAARVPHHPQRQRDRSRSPLHITRRRWRNCAVPAAPLTGRAKWFAQPRSGDHGHRRLASPAGYTSQMHPAPVWRNGRQRTKIRRHKSVWVQSHFRHQ